MRRLAEGAAELAAEVRAREAGGAGEVVDVERLEVPGVGEVLGAQQVPGGRDEGSIAPSIAPGCARRQRYRRAQEGRASAGEEQRVAGRRHVSGRVDRPEHDLGRTCRPAVRDRRVPPDTPSLVRHRSGTRRRGSATAGRRRPWTDPISATLRAGRSNENLRFVGAVGATLSVLGGVVMDKTLLCAVLP